VVADGIVKHGHFVPVVCLKKFAGSDRLIRVYERGQPIVPRKPKKIAWDWYLYATESENGGLNQDLEEAFADVENEIAPLLRTLDKLRADQELSPNDTALLMTFVALQALRTPSARTRLRKLDSKLLSSADLDAQMGKIVGARVAQKSWWLDSIGRLSQPMLRALSHKTMAIYRNSTAVPFITSDDPVVLVRNEIYPVGDSQAFFQAHVLFPIGSKAMLCFHLPDVLWPRDERKHRTIEIRSADDLLVEEVNAAVMRRASRFIFACEACEAIRNAFDQTSASDALDSFAPTNLPALSDPARRLASVAPIA